ncbi:MAG: UMP kinase [Candidatus Bathyarchaeia archaeon]
MRVSVKIGGFAFKEELDAPLLKAYSSEIRKLSGEGHQLIIVTGGGGTARRYIDASRILGAPEALCDELGIAVSRVNALLLLSSLWDVAYRRVPSTLEEAIAAVKPGRPVIMGGLQPGQSTNAVAALAAELIGADLLVNLTDVEGVYSKDPKIYGDARLLEEVTVERLEAILSGQDLKAGGYKLMDPLALKIIKRGRINTVILSGLNPENLRKAVRSERIGTRITFK